MTCCTINLTKVEVNRPTEKMQLVLDNLYRFNLITEKLYHASLQNYNLAYKLIGKYQKQMHDKVNSLKKAHCSMFSECPSREENQFDYEPSELEEDLDDFFRIDLFS